MIVNENGDTLLTIWEISEKWADENLSIAAETLAVSFARQVVSDDFSIEMYRLDGQATTVFEMSFDWFAKGETARLTHDEILQTAKNTMLSIVGFHQLCGDLGFTQWCNQNGLRRPSFIEEADSDSERDTADDITDGNILPVRGGYSRSKLRGAYKDRVKSWPGDKRHPSQEADIEWAREKFGSSVDRESMRVLRRDYAPDEWSRAGAPKKSRG